MRQQDMRNGRDRQLAGKLTALDVKRKRQRGMYGDGHGLYLQVHDGKSRSWILRYKVNGRTRHLGLGPVHAIGLAEARMRAADARRQLIDGFDPIAARQAARIAARLADAKIMTFDQAADEYIAAHRSGWKSSKHAAQWAATLRTYASPVFGSLPVQAVDSGFVMRVLQPLWSAKTETASRLRTRIENVLDWARVKGYRTGENPARWEGNLDHLLPKPGKVRKVAHHAAMPYAELPAFMVELRKVDSIPARALDFGILTSTRTKEILGARFEEIDFDAKTWTIPADRMKAKREHRVPLSDAALALLGDRQATGYCFPGRIAGKPLGNMAMMIVLRRMGHGDLTVHGFRSSFRVWCAEQTNFPSEVAEAALAHIVSDKTVAAYQRTDFFDRRVQLMQAWASYCAQRPADVVPMRRA
jgi:integrase